MNTLPIPGPLADFPVVLELPVQWGEQDAYGHVNNAVAVRWFESSRVAYIIEGQLGGLLASGRLGVVVASIGCNYRRQIRHPDTVWVGARMDRVKHGSMTFHHAVFSQANDAVAADGHSTVAIFDHERQRPVRIPDEVRTAIEKLEGKPFEP